MSGTRQIRAVIAIWSAGFALLVGWITPLRAAENYGGFSGPMEFLMAEVKKQDTATLVDAVQEIWQVRASQDSLFCKAMVEKPEDFRLWCQQLARFCSEAASDTALDRVQQFRSRIIDPKSGLLSRPSKCRELDSAIVAALTSTSRADLIVPIALTSDQANRRISFWNVLWKHRGSLNRRRCAKPMVELLSQFPNEFYDASGGVNAEFRQFVGSLDEVYFTARNKSEADRLELFRQGLIARLESGIVGNRFKSQNDMVITRLKSIVTRSLD
ncbi:MAG: hypothetical protein WAU88_00120 [Candidatus Zixiibacteriota bacterium]